MTGYYSADIAVIYQVLKALSNNGPLNQSTICRKVKSSRAVVIPILKRLQQIGCITRMKPGAKEIIFQVTALGANFKEMVKEYVRL